MGNYVMSQLRNLALRNYTRGITRFKAFGNISVEIKHQHDNEHGVIIYDPVAHCKCEVLRIVDASQPYCI